MSEASGRDSHGRFAPSNNLGVGGSRHAIQMIKLRAEIYRCLTPKDVQKVIKKLIQLACNGNVMAAQELLNRALGKPTQAVEITEPPATTTRKERREQLVVLMKNPDVRNMLKKALEETEGQEDRPAI